MLPPWARKKETICCPVTVQPLMIIRKQSFVVADARVPQCGFPFRADSLRHFVRSPYLTPFLTFTSQFHRDPILRARRNLLNFRLTRSNLRDTVAIAAHVAALLPQRRDRRELLGESVYLPI